MIKVGRSDKNQFLEFRRMVHQGELYILHKQFIHILYKLYIKILFSYFNVCIKSKISKADKLKQSKTIFDFKKDFQQYKKYV